MAKKKKSQLEAWCWYCDREFEDDKVLLQHQKAKHYKCPYCPRRLNTAGGLTVHLHQVHKAEPTKIENALPGRDSFDIEIYGMAGIPEADLAEWRARRANQSQNGGVAGQPAAKRQKIENVALTPEQLRAQLEAHKALMSGHAPPPGSMPPAGFPPTVPPPPPPFGGHYGPPSGFPQGPPPSYPGPPPSLGSQSTSFPPVPPAGMYNGPPPNVTVPQPSPHQIAVKEGAKSRLVYSDQNLSPEEKLASSARYLYIDPDDPTPSQQSMSGYGSQQGRAGPSQQQPRPPTWALQQQQQHYYSGPPPPLSAQSNSSPYPYVPPPNANSPAYPIPPSSYGGITGSQSPHVPPPGFGSASPSAAQHGVPTYSGPPPGFSSPAPPPLPASASIPPYGSPPAAQSYPALPPGGQPPAAQPAANTAEALARTNAQVQAANAVANGSREVDAQRMEGKAQQERKSDDAEQVSVVEASPAATSESTATVKPTSGRRAKAADLF